jgi:shikimate dehydrogenase
MDRYGLLGKQIGYAKSPKIHQYMAQKLGLDIRYDLFDVEESDIPTLMKLIRNQTIKGINVTIPYKQTVMKYVDQLTPKANRIKAVNTIYYKNGKLIGDNTDYDGFMGLLLKHQIQVKDKNVYLLGAGGAAKAAYCVLQDLGAHVIVVSRHTHDLDPLFQHVTSFQKLNPEFVDLYVQATPIGTFPNVTESVIDASYVKNHTVIDLVYNPEVTQIMKDAKVGIGGIYMLLIQALKSEEIWFEIKHDMTKVLLDELKEVVLK